MPKLVKPLTAIEVKRLDKAGLHAVGTVPGLGLSITPEGSKSWVYRTSYGGSRRKMGLGGYPAVTLSNAIEKARQLKTEIDELIKAFDSSLLDELIKLHLDSLQWLIGHE